MVMCLAHCLRAKLWEASTGKVRTLKKKQRDIHKIKMIFK
jgi:hypothetical protein